MSIPTRPIAHLKVEELRQHPEWLRITLASIGDGVVTTDAEGRVTYLNPVAERLTGWKDAEAQGQPIEAVFRIINERTRAPAENPSTRALRGGTVVGLANHTLLIARDGSERPIDDSAAPMLDESGWAVGAVLVFRDVTERRRAEEERSRLAAIVETSDDAIISKSLDGIIRTWNAGAEQLFGFSAQEAIGQSITLIIPPELRDEEKDILARLRQGERIEHFETVRLAKNGRRIDISLSISPVRDSEGHVIGASKIAREITQQKLAQRRLDDSERSAAESQARLQFAARVSGTGFWYCDLPFAHLNWDERVKEHFWLPASAHATIETFYERLHPEDRQLTRDAIDAAIEGRTTMDIDYRTVDPQTGALKWIRAVGAAAYAASGEPYRFDGVTLDITDRKVNELRLARSLEREREQARLLRRVADAALAIHSSGSLDSVLRVVADEARQIIGARLTIALLAVREDGAPMMHVVSAAEELGERTREAALRTIELIQADVRRNGGPIRLTGAELEYHQAWKGSQAADARVWRGLLAAPFMSRGGRMMGLIQLADKEADTFTENDESILAQLAHIASVALENARLYDELRDQDRRKDEFLALLAHELRNPLAPLRNGLQVMRLAASDANAVAQARGMMDRQLSHMVRLIDDLLDISRISRNKMELRRSRVLLADIIHSAVETARPLIEAGQHDFNVSLPNEAIILDADHTRLAQVFSNLLTNSAKYTERGGCIWLTAARTDSTIAVTIRDTGIGIPSDALPTIFDMFSQVDRSIERSTGGLGIGLALVKGLVEMHGGHVQARSEGLGRGSTFTVRLPIAEADPAPATSSTEASKAAGPRRKILVVDDSRDAAESMALMLQLLGNDLRTAHDGIEAGEVAEVFRPDVIFMDVGMPKRNGYEATSRIREQPWGKNITIIALTGWGQDADRDRSRAAGCDAHLVKPVGLQELERVLENLKKP